MNGEGSGPGPDRTDGAGTGVSYVKSRDVPMLRQTADSDARLRARLDAMAPDERAAEEERIRASAGIDQGRINAHRSTRLAAVALGWCDPQDERWADDDRLITAVAAQSPLPGLSFRGMRHDVPVADDVLTTRGCTAMTPFPALALAQPRATRRDLDIVGERLTAIWGHCGRDGRGISRFPDDKPVIYLPESRLRPLGRHDVDGVQVTAYVETGDGEADAKADAGNLWGTIAKTLAARSGELAATLARQPNPYFAGELA